MTDEKTALSDTDNVMFRVVEGYKVPDDGFTDDEVSRILDGQSLVAAGASFHLPGRHDQDKHGHDHGGSASKSSAVSSGKKLKITHALIHKKRAPGTVIAESGSGDKRALWDGKQYQLQSRNVAGEWLTKKTAIKSKAYDALKEFSDDWREPTDSSVSDALVPSVVAPEVTTPVTVQHGIKTYTPAQKAQVQSIFASHNLKWHNKTDAIYDAAQEVSTTMPALTMADALDIMDQSLQKKTGNPFRTKVEKWLQTNAGKQHVLKKGSSAGVGGTVPVVQPSPAPPTSTTPKAAAPASTTPAVTPSATPEPSVIAPSAKPKKLNATTAEDMQARMNKSSPPPWTAAQRDAIKVYTGSDYRSINGCARGMSECSAWDKKFLRHIKAATKPAPEAVTLYRGTNLDAFGIKSSGDFNNLVGKVIKDKGVISTSIDDVGWEGSVSLEIEAPPGTMMAYVQSLSKFDNENEMILAPGTSFEVVSVNTNSYPTRIKLRAIPPVNSTKQATPNTTPSATPNTTPSTTPTAAPATQAKEAQQEIPASPQSKTYTPLQRSQVRAIFDKEGLKPNGSMKKIYSAALEVSKKYPDLTMADALDIMDQSTGKPGSPYRTRIEQFLTTSTGKWFAEMKGGSAPQGATKQVVKPVTPTVAEPKPTAAKKPQPAAPTTEKLKSSAATEYKTLTISDANAMQKAMNEETPPPWTQEQRDSIRFYTNGPYRELNGCLRGVAPCTPELSKHIKVLKSVMKPSTEDIVVRRGADPRSFGLDRKKFIMDSTEGIKILQKLTGKTVTDKGVISTTIDPNFSWSSLFTIQIEVPKGTKMAWVQSVSGHKKEQEIILNPNTRFEIISAEETTFGNYNIRMRVVPDEGVI